MENDFHFKFNDKPPELLKQEEEEARQRAVEEFIARGGQIETVRSQEISRPNTAR